MTEQLKQLREALRRVKHEAASLADAQVIALEALTTSQPAQTEREAFEAEMRCEETWGHRSLRKHVDGRYQNWVVDVMWDVWQARAPLPTQPAAQATPPQQAAGEPVGEVAQLVPEILSLADEYAEAEAKAGGLTGCGGDVGQQHELDEDAAYIKGRLTDAVGKLAAIATHPAPAVPEGLPAVLTDWGFDVHDDEEGRTWLTIRNPDDDVARMSVPTVWPLNGNQTIGAVVLHQFSAALTSALAAAQAKGADHD